MVGRVCDWPDSRQHALEQSIASLHRLRDGIRLVDLDPLYDLGQDMGTTRCYQVLCWAFRIGILPRSSYVAFCSCWPQLITVFLIGSWYTKDELGKRSNIFQAATAAGTLLSGVLQGGVQTTLHGKSGMPGWRWIFTIDAVISLPIAIAAFFFIPDLPSVIKPGWIFKQDDIDLANKRLASVGRVGPKKGGLGLKALWKIITTWEIFVFTFVYSCYIFSQSK